VTALPQGWSFRDLADPDDRPALRKFFDEASDYILLETGLQPSEETIDGLFSNAPPGGDPKDCNRIGVFDAESKLKGIGEQSFGYPNQTSSYIGLVMLATQAQATSPDPHRPRIAIHKSGLGCVSTRP